ncbi:hypothetical protein [Sphaerisporangium rhizosphaerae]|uniref:Uncharacterized protein n=1 Tax=Sphaerisporangium rhizosphaerae TaxID=2269375 RepID=A0ABW2NT97_9ACTN
MTSRAIYAARRAVEHAVTVPGVRPLRLFPVLWPLWQVEISANVYEEQAYEVIDRFLERAVVEGGIDSRDELARFFGLQPALVDRCLAFLGVIGHLTVDGGVVRLTELGLQSLRAGVRLTPKESRQKVLIERFTGRPLPRRYHHGSLHVLPEPRIPDHLLADRSRFLPLFTPTAFEPAIVDALAARPDRTEYNLPSRLRDITTVAAQDAYLPAYLVETERHALLAYTAIGDERDTFLEEICRDVPSVQLKIDAETRLDRRELWTEWLAESRHGPGRLQQLRNGVWRVTLSPAAFSGAPRLSLSSVGSFQLRKYHFLQLWCDDQDLRGRAVAERALGMARLSEVRTQNDLVERIGVLADRLEVKPPSVADLRAYATTNGLHDHLSHLDALA